MVRSRALSRAALPEQAVDLARAEIALVRDGHALQAADRRPGPGRTRT